MAQCDVYFKVNFGRGLVEVRCTLQSEHEQHICEVYLQNNPSVQHKNVFEKESPE